MAFLKKHKYFAYNKVIVTYENPETHLHIVKLPWVDRALKGVTRAGLETILLKKLEDCEIK